MAMTIAMRIAALPNFIVLEQARAILKVPQEI
jgi:hypothetical protein